MKPMNLTDIILEVYPSRAYQLPAPEEIDHYNYLGRSKSSIRDFPYEFEAVKTNEVERKKRTSIIEYTLKCKRLPGLTLFLKVKESNSKKRQLLSILDFTSTLNLKKNIRTDIVKPRPEAKPRPPEAEIKEQIFMPRTFTFKALSIMAPESLQYRARFFSITRAAFLTRCEEIPYLFLVLGGLAQKVGFYGGKDDVGDLFKLKKADAVINHPDNWLGYGPKNPSPFKLSDYIKRDL